MPEIPTEIEEITENDACFGRINLSSAIPVYDLEGNAKGVFLEIDGQFKFVANEKTIK